MPPPAAAPAFSNKLLRPGTEIVARVDLSLDGSTPGQIAVTSRYTVTAACQALFADVYSLVDGHWRTVFSATDPALPYGPLLGEPQSTAGSCYPKIRLFSAEPATAGGNALLLLGIGYGDTSARLAVIGWDSNTASPEPLFDWHTGTNATIARSTEGGRVDITEDAPLPAAMATSGIRGTPGRLVQSVALDGGLPHVETLHLAPPCSNGRIAAGTTRGRAVPETGRLLVLDCSAARGISLVPENAQLEPAGVMWTDLRDGDSIQIEYEASSLDLKSGEPTLPQIATLTDEAALARHQSSQKQVQPALRPVAPALPTRSRVPNAASNAPAPYRSNPPRTTAGTSLPPPTVRSQPRSSGPPMPPLTAVTAPSAPRNAPFAGPPPVPR